MKTWKLKDDTWDIYLGVDGTIVMNADNAHQCAQDVATAVRTFRGECPFDTTKGMPYFGQILGGRPPNSVLNAYVEKEAKRIDGVIASVTEIDSIENRVLKGTIYLTLADNEIVTVNL